MMDPDKANNDGNHPKTVKMDLDVQRKDHMTKSLKKSLKKAKKKVHNYEMTAQARSDSKSDEIKQERDLDNILSTAKPPIFPSLAELKRENEIKNPCPIILSTGEIVLTKSEREKQKRDEKSRKLSQETLDALEAGRASKNYGVTSYFGGKIEGEELGHIKKYEGLNTFDRGSRILVRKGPFFPQLAQPPNLPWFYPGYYKNMDTSQTRPKPIVTDFAKMTWRHKKSAAEFRAERQVIAEKNMKFFKGENDVDEKSYAASSVCTRPHSQIQESELIKDESLRSPFSRLSAESTIGLDHPESRRSSKSPHINLSRRPSQSLKDTEPDKNNELSIYDTIQHDNRYYFASTESTATTLIRNAKNSERKPKDFLKGSLALQTIISIDDNDGDDDSATSIDGTLSKNEIDDNLDLNNGGSITEGNNSIHSNNNNNNENYIPPLFERHNIQNYIDTWRTENKIFSPIKRKVSSDFKSDIVIPKSENVEKLVPSYMLIQDVTKDLGITDTHTIPLDYSPPTTARTQDTTDESIVSENELLETQELEADELEWEAVIKAKSAAEAFSAFVLF